MRQLPGGAREGSQAAASFRRRTRLPAARHGGRGRRELLTPRSGHDAAFASRHAHARQDLLKIFDAAVAAVDPSALARRYLADRPPQSASGRFLVAGAGKAAARMAEGCEAALGDACAGGLVVVADGCEVPLRGIEIAHGAHPIPDRRSLDAATRLASRLARSRDPVLCLVSGGASSLLVQPRPPVTMADKVEANRLLLASGASIGEVNVVRKHLSLIKGGGLLRIVRPRPLLTLLLSDVVGDDPSLIGSGPTTPDPSSFLDARSILDRYGLLQRVGSPVRELLDRGARGDAEETVKPNDAAAALAEAVVIGNNRTALAAAAVEAQRLGYEPLVDDAPLVGDTTLASRIWFERIGKRIAGKRRCAIAGGETTVVVRGTGLGGRNQEFALALVESLAGRGIALLSAGTDGIDGPTDAAGAVVDGRTLQRAAAMGLDARSSLAANDSYRFFEPLGDLLRCGPTGTNVMDVKLAVGLPS